MSDTDDCYRFIKEYINFSEKSNTILFKYVDDLKDNCPFRLSHVMSTFFLGLWFFNHKRSKFLHNSIVKELKRLACFQDNQNDIEKQFAFVWFMATLFHDLGYPAEDKKDGEIIPSHDIPEKDNNGNLFNESVPFFYKNVYKDYYNKYRENKEHGIYAGLIFDKEICDIRRYQCDYSSSKLDWKEELEELYHYVAWIILSHNIWMIRDDNKKIGEYKKAGLNNLILSSEKNDNDQYIDYRIRFYDYPLFTFFCIIDTIEPLKSTSCLSNVDIVLNSGKITIKSNDCDYLRKIKGLNDWLMPTIENNGIVEIRL